MPNFSQNLRIFLLLNWVPLSEINIFSMLNLVTKFSHRKIFTFESAILTKGTTSTHLVKYSVATNKNFLKSKAFGKSLIMSSPYCANGQGLLRDAI